MGQQLTTPLSLTLGHWKEVQNRAHKQSIDVKNKKWVTFCSSEWPTFEVGWPRDGTFNANIISQVKARVFQPGAHGHPDQVPYITMWEDLSQDPPSWVKPFVSTPLPPTLISPPAPPPTSSTPLVPSPPVPPTSSLYPLEEISKLKPAKPPVLPAHQDLLLFDSPPPYIQPPPPQNSPQRLEQDPCSSGPDPDSTGAERNAPAPSPPSSRLHLRREHAGGPEGIWTTQAFPLRSVAGQMQYWPFSASDLYNWKTHNPSFSQDPQALTGLIEPILLTHQPTWDDCQPLMQTLLTTEEKQRVYLEAGKNVPGADGRPTQLPNEIEEAFPLTRPDWDYTTVAGRERLRLYRQVLLARLKGAGKRPTNLAKTESSQPAYVCF
ncbi:coiled-coil domain-containing protein 86-like [Lepus europaeus]|uniref:coiled-coil domain-containing protein 86-like n=1 Tax=Lepus europaeus TaxID=9983 RepID=UPI002B49EC51|nr:coiled-coil domain-containing protein 86-like [Lepus europaeus]